ncbi:MAG: GDP-mannose 4,6-dehydratase [Candidatus Obscuribacterales bacterium]
MTNKANSILVTGGAGFIGSHLVDRLLREGKRVTVIDNFNSFYSPDRKRENVSAHLGNPSYELIEGDLRSVDDVARAFSKGPFDVVVHLAAMAGVLPSLQNPSLYMDVNVLGTQRILDAATAQETLPYMVFCSSSSVYGERSTEKFSETDLTDRPLSPYAASKIAGEVACFAAHKTKGLNVICVRPFTVFGPRQRPDLAIHKFSQRIEKGEPIELYGDGTTKRDYTFVLDIVAGIDSAIEIQPAGFEIVNLGRSNPVTLLEMIDTIQSALGKKAQIVRKPMQNGDVPYTYADIEKARKMLNYTPATSFEEGINEFVQWFRKHELTLSTK